MKNIINIQKLKLKNILQDALELHSTRELVFELVTCLFPHTENIVVVAIGKSATAMLEGTVSALGRKFSSALLITKDKPESIDVLNNPDIKVILAGHPIPNEASLAAGKKLIEYLKKLHASDNVLFLLSGGTSALVEVLPYSKIDPITLLDLQKLNKWLLGSNKNIMEMNLIRKKISEIKAGRLLNSIACNTINSLYISDVPDDQLKNIGSGLLIPEDISLKIKNIPVWVEKLLSRAEKNYTPNIINTKKIHSNIIFSNSQLRTTIVDTAHSENYSVYNMPEFILGNTITESHRIAHWLLKQKNGMYVWGAETHMELPEHPGRGGRNQSFALAMASIIKNIPNMVVLVAGTDGNDGNTDDAGAIIDGDSINRGEQQGLSALDCLESANAGEFLAAAGDILSLPSTGTNVMDIIIAFKWD